MNTKYYKRRIKIENKQDWIWFSLIQKIGIKNKYKLLEVYKTPKNIKKQNNKQLKKLGWLKEEQIEEITNIQIKKQVEKHYEYMKKHKIDLITIEDKNYPQKLKNIYDPPIYLYTIGNKKLLNNNEKNISIVGCRECTKYGKEATKYFAYNLAKEKIVIVSGLAKGIDSYSHKNALLAKGKTIAVIGNGIDITYPKENINLVKEIIEKNGLIISEYPLGTKPQKMYFPARNRIISGLSNATLIIEAKEKSGSLLTAEFALEQGREVFAIPGNINSINSVGTNDLIKQGAKLVTNYKEILEDVAKMLY